MIELALHYAAQGWPVFPLRPGEKAPIIIGSFHNATTHAAAVEAWWAKWPDANIGIATGTVSDLLVIDVDVKKGKQGLQSLQELQLPQTLTIGTPSRGWHLYFRMPPGRPIRIGADLLPGIDWRGEGGYVVAAGSVTPQGMYEIRRRHEIAQLPPRVVDLLRRVRRRAQVQLGEDGELVIAEGARDSTLTSIAGSLRRHGVGAPVILECLRAINQAYCAVPHAERDLERIAGSVGRYRPERSGRA